MNEFWKGFWVMAVMALVIVLLFIGLANIATNQIRSDMKIYVAGSRVQLSDTSLVGTIINTDVDWNKFYLIIIVDTNADSTKRPTIRVDSKDVKIYESNKSTTKPSGDNK